MAGATALDLLQTLALRGVMRPAALRAELGGISAQTLGRLIAGAGEGTVLRIGKGRATSYARTRLIEGLGRSAPVFRVSETGSVSDAGTLRFLAGSATAWEEAQATTVFAGLPPALADMSPQGYLGRGFPARHPELRLPARITDWSDDHRLIALALRGEDCVGDLILGDASLQRFVEAAPREVGRERFPELARQSVSELVGSSAGGERPKFGVLSEGRHVLVKFAPPDAEGPAARRWRDLLWCEWKALELIAQAGRPASRATCFDLAGWRFLVVDRFDRVGDRGRRAVLTLAALNHGNLGTPESWTAAAPMLSAPPLRLPAADASDLRWLDVFGQLIGNTDRHFGNAAFYVGSGLTLRLAPAYDMLPMILAPSAEVVVERPFEPQAPRGATLDVWQDAARSAVRYWAELCDQGELAPEVRAFAERAGRSVEGYAKRVASDGAGLPPA